MTPQQWAALTGPAVDISAGCELLAPDLKLAEDISDDLAGGSVQWALHDSIHRACTLSLSRELVWGVDLVRPYMIVNGERFDCGVFSLTTPERRVGEAPETYQAQGFDRLYLLSRQVGDDYSIAAGTTYRQALLDVFSDAGLSGVLIEGSAADDVLPDIGGGVGRSWPLVAVSTDPDQTDSPVTWLRVVNDLLGAIRFRGVWVDAGGLFRCEAYQDPASRAPLWTFDVDDLDSNIVGQDRSITADVWKTPNRWVVICSNPPEGVVPSEANGYIQVRENLDDGPTSIAQRGLRFPSVLEREAASTVKLAQIADDIMAADRRVTTRLSYSSGPFPAAGHADVFMLRDAAAGISAKVQSVGWSFDLSGSEVQWQLEQI